MRQVESGSANANGAIGFAVLLRAGAGKPNLTLSEGQTAARMRSIRSGNIVSAVSL